MAVGHQGRGERLARRGGDRLGHNRRPLAAEPAREPRPVIEVVVDDDLAHLRLAVGVDLADVAHVQFVGSDLQPLRDHGAKDERRRVVRRFDPASRRERVERESGGDIVGTDAQDIRRLRRRDGARLGRASRGHLRRPVAMVDPLVG